MESCPTQAVLPLVGLAAETVIRDRYSSGARLAGRPYCVAIPVADDVVRVRQQHAVHRYRRDAPVRLRQTQVAARRQIRRLRAPRRVHS
ncbi:MAG: hypothetical protein ACQESR_07795 [Planctomycetota bacterium]